MRSTRASLEPLDEQPSLNFVDVPSSRFPALGDRPAATWRSRAAPLGSAGKALAGASPGGSAPAAVTSRVWVVLPAYDEADNLPGLFAGLRALAASRPAFELGVIVVDDGSSDDTADVAAREGAELQTEILRNSSNRGLAETFRRGMRRAAEQASPGDAIVCMDADNSHLPRQIPELVAALDLGCDVVIASRYRRGARIEGVPAVRRLLSRGMSLLFRLVLPVPQVRDYSCGYRAYRAARLQGAIERWGEALFAAEGFACMVGILANLARDGATFREVPLVLRYDRKVGASKMRVGGTVIRTLGVLARARLDRR